MALLAAVTLVVAVAPPAGSAAALMPSDPAGAAGSAGSGWTAWVSSPTDATARLAVTSPTTRPVTATVQLHTGDRGQTWLGVGGALTDASTSILSASHEAARLLFDPRRTDGAHLNFVRLPLTSTDFSTSPWTFTWDDSTGTLTAPQQALDQLALLTDTLMPLRADLSVVASPWTAPASMKDSRALNGGSLLGGSVPEYARMLRAEVTWLLRRGAPLEALTLGNEPYHSASGPGGYPTMLMSDSQQILLADQIGAGVAKVGVDLWAVDHNWSDRAHYDTVEAGTAHRFQASAFHCYGGAPGQMSGVREPPVVTECTGTNDGFSGTFRWDAVNLVVSAVESGSIGLILWNLALNENHGPHTNGCGTCRGIVDVDSTSGAVTKNPEFFTLAHLARAADPGAVVIGTDPMPGLPHVAFLEPGGEVGIFAYNDTGSDQVVEVSLDGDPTGARFTVPAGNLLTVRGAASFAPGSIRLPDDAPEVGMPYAPTVEPWTPAPTQTVYQWLADGVPIADATSASFVPMTALIGRSLTLQVSARRPGYASGSVTSAPSPLVVGSESPAVRNVTPPIVVGLPEVGRTLYASPGEWSPSDVAFSYQWQRSGQPIAGATGSTYRLTAAELGQSISVVVRATAGPSEPSAAATATLAGPVAPGRLLVLDRGKLAGSARPGGTLSVAGLRLRPTATLRYSWSRDGKPAAPKRRTRPTYVVGRTDRGHAISVQVRASAPGYASRAFAFARTIPNRH